MSIKNLNTESIRDLILAVSQNEAKDYLFILPSLEIKKQMVESMALELQTVPDKKILRLNEFYTHLAQETEPLLQFLDKDLLVLLLKDALSGDKRFESYISLTQVALDYISIFSPILGRDIYRQAFEELIENDPSFLKNYGDIYGFMTQIWDQLNLMKRIIPSWSLGWLYKNFKLIEMQPKSIYIVGYDKLKQIEKDFFEELSLTWDIYDVQILNTQKSLTPNQNNVIQVTSLSDEILWCVDFLQKNTKVDSINFIIPKNKWFYKELLEVFVNEGDKNIYEDDKENLRSKINNFLSPLNLQGQDYSQVDIQNVFSEKHKDFKNFAEYELQIHNVFDLNLLKIKVESTAKPPSEAINFLTFLDWTLSSNAGFKDEVLRKLYTLALQIPTNLTLTYLDWLSFINLKLNSLSSSLKSEKFNFYTIEEMPWRAEETNVFLSCTRSDYEKNTFAYLTEFEVDKIKTDLGFDLEGIGLAETFLKELADSSQFSLKNYFLCPQYDHLGASQQTPKFIEELKWTQEAKEIQYDGHSNTEVEKVLKDINQCQLQNFTIKSLSASSLQKYIDSPFEFYLEKVLGQQDKEPLDFDPSALMSGSILHLLLEKGVEKNLDLQHLNTIVKTEIDNAYSVWSDTRIQEIQMSKYLEDIWDYIQKDNLEKQKTGRKTLFLEKNFKAFFDLTDLRFYLEEKKGRICFKGKIDRIDVVGKNCYVIDYKSTKASIENIKNLTSKPRVQMPIYAMMIQDGVIDVPYIVAGLIYIAIKDQFEIIPSLMLASESAAILGETISSRSGASADETRFKGVIEEYRKYMASVIKEMQHNTFSPLVYEGEPRTFNSDF